MYIKSQQISFDFLREDTVKAYSGNVFKFKIKTRRAPLPRGFEEHGGKRILSSRRMILSPGTIFYPLLPSYPGRWGNGEIAPASRWLVLLRYLSAAPHLPVPWENEGENEEGLYRAWRFSLFLFSVFFLVSLSLSLSSITALCSDQRGLDGAKVIRGTTM